MPKITTQDFLEFDQIKEGVIILKNKTLRAIIMVSSLNFALKSSEEQEAILYQFQSFLNSLDFSCQILISSRKLNITSYLDKLKEIEEKEENELLKLQIIEYQEFIKEIVAGSSIMQKTFYLIIPFIPWEGPQADLEKKLSFLKKTSYLSGEEFERSKVQLWQRVEFVILGLKRCGLQAVPLNTLELIELFWKFYHPLEAEKGYFPEIPPELNQ